MSARCGFVELEPHFSPDGDPTVDHDGLVWIYDAEGVPILKSPLDRVGVITAALEFAHRTIEVRYGMGWGNLSDDEAVSLLNGWTTEKGDPK